MEEIDLEKVSTFKQIVFALGWIWVVNPIFWVALLVYHISTKEKKFWTPGSYRVVYIFGWVSLLVCFLALIWILFLSWAFSGNW